MRPYGGFTIGKPCIDRPPPPSPPSPRPPPAAAPAPRPPPAAAPAPAPRPPPAPPAPPAAPAAPGLGVALGFLAVPWTYPKSDFSGSAGTRPSGVGEVTEYT